MADDTKDQHTLLSVKNFMKISKYDISHLFESLRSVAACTREKDRLIIV